MKQKFYEAIFRVHYTIVKVHVIEKERKQEKNKELK